MATTWLEFRSEPLSDVPEVMIRINPKNYWRDIICNHERCINTIVDFTDDQDEAEDIKFQHMKWHEDGMPE
jgi:hypothetical protein